MQQKKFSKRLNYDVIERLFDNDVVKPKKKRNHYSDSEDDRSSRQNSAYFHSDAEDFLEEDGTGLPSNHPAVRKRSRLEQKARSRRARDASTAGEESGTERGVSRPLTDGETDTEGNSWKIGLSLPGTNIDDDYGDDFDNGEGILD